MPKTRDTKNEFIKWVGLLQGNVKLKHLECYKDKSNN